MLIRCGFVANSSSSSYIIAVNLQASSIVCPCCNRIGISVIDFLEMIPQNYSSDETKVLKSSRVKILNDYYSDLKICNDNIIKYKRHNSDELNIHSYNGQITWGQYLQWEEESKASIESMIQLIEAVPIDLEVIEVQVSYHDDLTKRVLKNELNAGTIQIIYDNEDRNFE